MFKRFLARSTVRRLKRSSLAWVVISHVDLGPSASTLASHVATRSSSEGSLSSSSWPRGRGRSLRAWSAERLTGLDSHFTAGGRLGAAEGSRQYAKPPECLTRLSLVGRKNRRRAEESLAVRGDEVGGMGGGEELALAKVSDQDDGQAVAGRQVRQGRQDAAPLAIAEAVQFGQVDDHQAAVGHFLDCPLQRREVLGETEGLNGFVARTGLFPRATARWARVARPSYRGDRQDTREVRDRGAELRANGVGQVVGGGEEHHAAGGGLGATAPALGRPSGLSAAGPSGHGPPVETRAAMSRVRKDFPMPVSPTIRVSLPKGMREGHSQRTVWDLTAERGVMTASGWVVEGSGDVLAGSFMLKFLVQRVRPPMGRLYRITTQPAEREERRARGEGRGGVKCGKIRTLWD